MKKSLNEIFDEAKPSELEMFADELTAPELSAKVLASVKSKVYVKIKQKKKQKSVREFLFRFGVMAACFILIVSTVFMIPLLRGEGPGITPPVVTTQTDNPRIPDYTEDLIDSLDILNYYGGILSIKKEQVSVNPFLTTTPAAYTKAETLNFVRNGTSHEAERQYYDIEKIQEYAITKSIYFKIKIDQSCPFLYRLFGDGEIDVVVTKNNIDTIITFQKNKNFYSCLYSHGSADGNRNTDVFSTRKYIDGSYVVSDSSLDGILFYVSYEYDKTYAKYIENLTFEWNDGMDNEKTDIAILTFNGFSSMIEGSISIQEISDYYYNVYNQGLPNGELQYAFKGMVQDGSRVIYIHIYTSGEFYICDEKFLTDNSDPFAFYLRGMNSRVSSGHIFLQYNDENGEAVILETTASSSGGFRLNGIMFTPYSITEKDTENLTVLYFAAYDENGKVIKYLRADTDGTFIAGEPMYIDPYYDGYIHKKLTEGYWGINEEGTYFIYYKGNKKITLSGVDYKNGEPLNISNEEYYLCDNPFPADEVTEVRKTVDGIELRVTRDKHYIIVDVNGGILEQGKMEYKIWDMRSVYFYQDQPNGEQKGFIGYLSADDSIIYSDYIFYPTQHLVFDSDLTNEPTDIVLRFDIVDSSDKHTTVYIMRDYTFFVWDHLVGYTLYGKGTAVFENDGIRMKDVVGYGDTSEMFAEWTDSASQTEFTLEGDVYRLVYDLRSK